MAGVDVGVEVAVVLEQATNRSDETVAMSSQRIKEAIVAPAARAVKVGCQVCYGVIFVGVSANGKFYCQTCRRWTRAKV